MSLDHTPVCHLPYILPAQAQKHVTHNEALSKLDVLVQLSVMDRDLTAPPPSPADGDCYIVAGSPSGDWSGHAGEIAHRLDGAWEFITPATGWIAWVIDEAMAVTWTGSAWATLQSAITTLQNLALIGIGTTADATNPFSAKLNKALWTAKTAAEGGDGDLRYTLNKETAADVLSLLMQRGFSGRAEIGLIGDDMLTLKVSGNGSNWVTALTVGAGGKLSLGRRMMMRPDIPRRNHLTAATWLASTSAADNSWFGLCWAAEIGRFCAVSITGTGDRAMTSPDGITWTSRTSAADNDWRAVCWSRELGLLVAVSSSGTGNRVMTSPDGITWTSRTSAADNNWFSVCWSAELGLFCAVADSGTGNRVMTSPDGITWTARTSAADNNWRAVCWSPELGLFCATAITGTGNRVMTSPDGITWTIRTSAADNQWMGVCWSAELGLFCAVSNTGTGNRVMTSPDGIAWTARTSAADNGWFGVEWSPEIGLLCAVGISGTGTRVMTSPDGITWTTRASAADNDWRAVAWSPELGLFGVVASTGTGNRAATSVSTFKYPYRS